MKSRREMIIEKGSKVLNLFESNKRIVPYILSHSNVCDNIISKEKIGSGSQSKVYKVKFRNDRKTYVMKSINQDDSFYVGDVIYKHIKKNKINISKLSMKEFIDMVLDYFLFDKRINWKKVLNFNNLHRNDEPSLEILDYLSIPTNDIECKVSTSYIFDCNNSLDKTKSLTTYMDDFVCVSSVYSEGLISLLLTELVEDEICYHFTKFYGMVRCDDSLESFVEKMDNSLDSLYYSDEDINDMFTPANFFSILISIYIMNNLHSICHNDLAFRNILIKRTDRTNSTKNKKYIQYNIDNVNFRFPMPKYIYKINDFGFSQKFKHPMILNFLVVSGYFPTLPCYDSKGLFDLFYILSDMVILLKKDLKKETLDILEELEIYLFGSVEEAEEKLTLFYESTLDDKKVDFDINNLIKKSDVLSIRTLKKIFRDYIQEGDEIDSTFIATNYSVLKAD